jgi:hypothetical protein
MNQWGQGAGEWAGGAWNTIMGQTGHRAQRQTLATDQGDQQRQLQMRGQQGMWSDELRKRALGQGPSVAEQQMGAGLGAATMAARSTAASGRGGNVGLTQRLASQQAAQGTSNVIRDAGMLRAQEMQTAGQTYSQDMQNQRLADLQARGMSIDEARAQLQADMEREKINAGIAEGNIERYQKGTGGLISSVGALFASDRRAKEDIQPMYSDFATKEQLAPASTSFGQQLRAALAQPQQPQPAPQQIDAAALTRAMETRRPPESEPRPAQSGGADLSGLMQSFGGSLQSDLVSKELYPTPEQPNLGALDEAEANRRAFEAVEPVRYRYKPEDSARMAMEQGATPGEQAMVFADKRTPRNGIIAQDLEQSPAYAGAVVETPAGKAVDRDRALSETLAQSAGFDKRLRELEAYLKSDKSETLKKRAEVRR